jgi:hypothetical protein
MPHFAGNKLLNLLKKKVIIILRNIVITSYCSKKCAATNSTATLILLAQKAQMKLEEVALKFSPLSIDGQHERRR